MSDAIIWAERELQDAQREQNDLEQTVQSLVGLIREHTEAAAKEIGEAEAKDIDGFIEEADCLLRQDVFWKALANAEEKARDAEGRLSRLIEEDERRAYQAAVL